MVISVMLNITIIIITLTINRKDSQHNMPYVPKRKRPPRSISINMIYRIMTLACQYVEHHIQTMKIIKKHYNNNKFKRNNKIVRRVRWDMEWLHCHMHSMTTSFDKDLKRTTFDTDSYPIMFNDGASTFITNDLGDFISTLTSIQCNVKGISGNAQATFKGMVRWQLEDDQDTIHKLNIPNSYYIVATLTRILSQQHFAQQTNDHYPDPDGTGCITTSSAIKLFWNQQRYSKTVTLDPKLNIAITYTALRIKQYQNHMKASERYYKDITEKYP